MTEYYLTHEGRIVQGTRSDSLADYFRKHRINAINRYIGARRAETESLRQYFRWNARRWALHYGRLLRKMEAGQ